MKRYSIILIASLASVPSFVWPQGLVPSLESEFDVCQSRPLQPQWIDDLSSREAFKGAVIQMIYRAESYLRVVEAGECSCATLYPTWDNAVQRFNDTYLNADRNALREARNEFRDQANEVRDAAKAICEEVGNW